VVFALPLIGAFTVLCSVQAQQVTDPTASEPGGAATTNRALRDELLRSQSTGRQWIPNIPGTLPGAGTNLQRAASEARDLAPPAGAEVLERGLPEEIEIQAGGALARYGRHTAHFAANVNAAEAIRLNVPAGNGEIVLKSRLVGLCFWDFSSGESVLFARPKDSVGEVISSSEVQYLDALEGTDADVLYQYTRNSFEQNVVLRKRIPAPQELGLSGSPSNMYLAVVTEMIDSPEPIRVPQVIDLREKNIEMGVQSDDSMGDETFCFGSMQMVASKAFSLGDSGVEVPAGKSLIDVDGRRFLIEFTPWLLVKAMVDKLPAGTLHANASPRGKIHSLLAGMGTPSSKVISRKEMRFAKAETRPGVVLDYLLVSTRLLNVNFGANTTTGFAAIGNTATDYWNLYQSPGMILDSISNLKWSDSPNLANSGVTMTVANAPGIWGWASGDPMYDSCIFQNPGNGNITITITGLPVDTYSFYIYGHYGTADGNGIFQLSRAGTAIGRKGTSVWGRASLSPVWEEGQQYVVFRGVAVNNQTITIEAMANAAGYPCINGLQIVSSAAVQQPVPSISKLINIDFAANPGEKTGMAAVGRSASDFWNAYSGANVTYGSLTGLRDSQNVTTSAGLSVYNAPGCWGWAVGDLMYGNYNYPWNNGNITAKLTSLEAGNYDFYLYGHTSTEDDNTIFHLWSGQRDYDTKATTKWGSGANSINWTEGQQYVVFRDVAVDPSQPVVILAGHNSLGYANLNGMQIVKKGVADGDSDGLPDAWELQYFGNLNQTASGDFDHDGISNLREYQLSLDPTRPDTDLNGTVDIDDVEFAWVEDATPSGGYQSSTGETWNWTTYWFDGDGWGGSWLMPYSGSYMHVSGRNTGALHEHGFTYASSGFMVNPGEVLYVYINLDPTYPPAEIMLQWSVTEDNGSSSSAHRAYWGADNILVGTPGISRYYKGPLPATGQWVRLEVQASAVGLEGKVVHGLTYSLWGGRAAWDRAGKLRLMPPVITSQPVGRSVLAGQAATFSVTATGLAPLAYQWFKDTQAISGATASSYSLAAAQAANAGAYKVVVSNPGGTTDSANAPLRIIVPPSITTQPSGQTVGLGAAVNLSVAATGTAPLTYQWFKNTALIAGATASSYSIAAAQPSDTGAYKVVVSNSDGSKASNEALLEVIVLPTITVPPFSQTVGSGRNVIFNVQASGTGPLAYQWFKGSTPIPGATSSSYSILAAQSSDAGNYKIRVSDTHNNSTEANATLSVTTVLTVLPASSVVDQGQGVTFSVQAGRGATTYCWRRNGTVLAGATGSAYTIEGVNPPSDAGLYTAEIAGSPTTVSQPVALTVRHAGVVAFEDRVIEGQGRSLGPDFEMVFDFSESPKRIIGYKMEIYSFKPAYQMIRDDLPRWPLRCQVSMIGKDSQTSVVIDDQLFHNWTSAASELDPRSFAMIYGNQNGCSSAINYIQSQISEKSACWASYYNFHITSSSDAPPTWFLGMVTCFVYPIERFSISGPGCDSPPVIRMPPASQGICSGAPVNFRVVASGSAPLSYQWQLNGVNIAGATDANYTMSSLSLDKLGFYSVLVTNQFGVAFSQPAVLSIPSAPTVSVVSLADAQWPGSSGAFRVSRSCADSSLKVYFTAGGSAEAGTQYQALGTFVEIPDGQTSSLVTVTPIASGTTPTDKTVSLSLTTPNGCGYSLGTPPSAQLLIRANTPAIRSEFTQGTCLPSGDDTYTAQPVPIGFWAAVGALANCGDGETQVYINNNGNITLDNFLAKFTQDRLIGLTNIIAPFSADVDTRSANNSAGTVCYGKGEVNGHLAFGVTWLDVGYYRSGIGKQNRVQLALNNGTDNAPDKLNRFQLVLINRVDVAPGDFDIEFNYERIEWERGAVGSNGFGDPSARAGFHLGTEYYELPGSGLASAFLDSNTSTGLKFGSHGCETPGRYIYQIRGGKLAKLPAVVSNLTTGTSGTTQVSLTVPGHADARIYYTTDGSGPTCGATRYTTPLTISGNILLRAFATELGWLDSPVSVIPVGAAWPTPPGLVACWSAENNMEDRSGRHNGLCQFPRVGEPRFAAGKVGQAFDFTHGEVISVLDDAGLRLSSSLTIEGWFKHSIRNSGFILARGTRNPSGSLKPYSTAYSVKADASLSSLIFDIADGGARVQAPYNLDQWNHFAAVLNYAEGKISLYINGRVVGEQATTVQPQSLITGDPSVAIGSQVDGTSTFPGLVDELAVYARALSAFEIQQIYSAGANGKLPLPAAAPLPKVLSLGPVSQAVEEGMRAAFTVVSEGTGLTYKWYRNGTPIPDFNYPVLGLNGAPFLVLNSVATADTGEYTVKASNSRGDFLSSDSVTLSVTPSGAPKITTQLQSQTAIEGSLVTFTVGAVGRQPLQYVWTHDGNILSATGPSLVLSPVALAHSGTYAVTIRNSIGPEQSSAAVLVVRSPEPPCITAQPQSVTVELGGTATFSVDATGTAPITYQWWHGNSPLAGQTQRSLVLTGVNNTSDPGNYSVVVKNSFFPAGVASSAAVLTVVDAVRPVITTQPSDATKEVGDDVTFTVAALSSPPTTYQWRKNDVNILDATAPYLYLPKADLFNAGDYSVVVANAHGPTTSREAKLTMTKKGPMRLTYVNTLTLPVNEHGSYTLSFQILRDNSDAANFSVFKVDQVDSGSLFINNAGFDSINCTISPDTAIVWTPPANLTYPIPAAFSIRVSDGVDTSATSIAVNIVQKPRTQLFGWGINYYGQLGNGRIDAVPGYLTAAEITDLLNWQSMNNLIGTKATWELDEASGLGGYWDGCVFPPKPVLDLTKVKTLRCDSRAVDAVTTDGLLLQWGLDCESFVFGKAVVTNPQDLVGTGSALVWGQVGFSDPNLAPPNLLAPSPIPFTEPSYSGPRLPFTGIRSICGGDPSASDFRVALKEDGTLWSWGWNSAQGNGQLGRNPNEANDRFDCKSGSGGIAPRRIHIPGDENAVPGSGLSVAEVQSGTHAGIARCYDGSIWWWGTIGGVCSEFDWFEYSDFGSPNRPPEEHWQPVRLTSLDDPISGKPNPPVTQMSVNGNHYVVLKAGGTAQSTVWELGYVPSHDASGIVGIGMDLFYPINTTASFSDCTDAFTTEPHQVTGFPANLEIQSVCAGAAFGAAVTKSGDVWVWGHLLPDFAPLPPTKIESLKEISKVVTGWQCVLALDKRGLVWGWGYNNFDLFGLSNPIDWTGESNLYEQAVRIEGIENVTDIFCSGWTAFAVGTVEEGKPTGLVATPKNGTVSLTWNRYTDASNNEATLYGVYRSDKRDGPYELVATTSSNSYEDTGLSNGITYFYRVAAIVGGISTAQSWEKEAKPLEPPQAVTSLAAKKSCRGVKLTWGGPGNANNSPPLEYRIERAPLGGVGSYEPIVTLRSNVFEYLHETSDNTRAYRVIASNNSGDALADCIPTGDPACSPPPTIPWTWRSHAWFNEISVPPAGNTATFRWRGAEGNTPLSWRFQSLEFKPSSVDAVIENMSSAWSAWDQDHNQPQNLSAWLWTQFNSTDKTSLAGSLSSAGKIEIIARVWNTIITNPQDGTKGSVYTADRFSSVAPSLPAQVLLNGNPQGFALIELNRRLIDDYYAWAQPDAMLRGSLWGSTGTGDSSIYWTFQKYEFLPENLDDFVSSLQTTYAWLWAKFQDVQRSTLLNGDGSYSVDARLDTLTAALNRSIDLLGADGLRGSLYTPDRFPDGTLSTAAKALLEINGTCSDSERIKLNRLLLDNLLSPGNYLVRGPNWGSQLTGFRVRYTVNQDGSRNRARVYQADIALNAVRYSMSLLDDDEQASPAYEFSWAVSASAICWASVSPIVDGEEGGSSIEAGPVTPGGRQWNGALRAVPGFHQTYLNWDDDPLIDRYELYVNTDPSEDPAANINNRIPGTIRGCRFWHTVVDLNKTYRYQLVAYPYDETQGKQQSQIVESRPTDADGPINVDLNPEASPYDTMVLVEWRLRPLVARPIGSSSSNVNC